MLIVSHWLKGGHEDGAYRKIVTTIGETGDIKANATTKKKAEAMVRLLNAVNHGWKPSR
jgi:hypothetical protein